MGKTNVSTLNWSDRFALIDKFKPTDDTICTALNVTQDELDTARDLRSAGNFKTESTIKLDDYKGLLTKPVSDKKSKTASATVHTSPKTKTKTKTAKTTEKPTTATKVKPEPKKRGRKGSKIANAFLAVPADAVPADDFIAEHNISLAVLRQSRRFDKSGLAGSVRVKQDKETKRLMVWRESE